jgi:hypothetical protein
LSICTLLLPARSRVATGGQITRKTNGREERRDTEGDTDNRSGDVADNAVELDGWFRIRHSGIQRDRRQDNAQTRNVE